MTKVLLAMVLTVAAECSAQSTTNDGIKLGDVTFTATLRARLYSWDWFHAGVYQNEYAYSGNLPRLNFAETRGTLDLDAEIAVPFILGLPRTATAPAPQGALGLGATITAPVPIIASRPSRFRNSFTDAITLTITRRV